MPKDARVFVFDHVSVGVENLERAAEFYDACLAPLGYVRLAQNARSVGYGPEGYEAEAPFAIVASGPDAKAPVEASTSPLLPRVARRSIVSMRRPSARAVSMKDRPAFATTTIPATTRPSFATLTATGWRRCCTNIDRAARASSQDSRRRA